MIEPHELKTIAEAFSRTAAKYDALANGHPHQARLRNKVYAHIGRHVPAGSRILELNSGTGIDAAALAQRGYQVHATDIAPGMLARIQDKVTRYGLRETVSLQEVSFTDLDQIECGPFDAVFSNLGGLNCISDLSVVIDQLPAVLRPGGTIVWVLMPPVCLWEMAEVFRGKFRLAFRRLSKHGVRSHLEGFYFDVYYYAPQQVLKLFGPKYSHLEFEGLSVITPTAESKKLAVEFPRVYRLLARIDDALSRRAPWWGWGDFYIISMRYR